MGCINPIQMQIKDKMNRRRNIEISCGHCLNCLIKKQSQIEFLSKKELLETYKKGLSASFVTLTYDDNHLPINEKGFLTLKRKDVQNFIKNMRRQMEYHNCIIPFKYIYCGEYGDGTHSTTKTGVSTCRPHYHLVFFGLGPETIKKYTRKLWKNGLCDIGCLSAGGIRYLCKYMTKSTPDKNVKKLREIANVQNPFFYHSIGLGKDWILKNMDKIVEDEFTFNLNGKRYLFPKYVIQFVAVHKNINYLPYVRKFIIKSENYQRAISKNIKFSVYDYETSFLRYKEKVANLKANGKPIDDFTLSKAFVRPKHSWDRIPHIEKLADLALYGDVVPF